MVGLGHRYEGRPASVHRVRLGRLWFGRGSFDHHPLDRFPRPGPGRRRRQPVLDVLHRDRLEDQHGQHEFPYVGKTDVVESAVRPGGQHAAYLQQPGHQGGDRAFRREVVVLLRLLAGGGGQHRNHREGGGRPVNVLRRAGIGPGPHVPGGGVPHADAHRDGRLRNGGPGWDGDSLRHSARDAERHGAHAAFHHRPPWQRRRGGPQRPGRHNRTHPLRPAAQHGLDAGLHDHNAARQPDHGQQGGVHHRSLRARLFLRIRRQRESNEDGEHGGCRKLLHLHLETRGNRGREDSGKRCPPGPPGAFHRVPAHRARDDRLHHRASRWRAGGRRG